MPAGAPNGRQRSKACRWRYGAAAPGAPATRPRGSDRQGGDPGVRRRPCSSAFAPLAVTGDPCVSCVDEEELAGSGAGRPPAAARSGPEQPCEHGVEPLVVVRRARLAEAARARAFNGLGGDGAWRPRARRVRTRQAPGPAGGAAARGAWPAWSGARAPTRCRCFCAQPPRWTVGRPFRTAVSLMCRAAWRDPRW